METQLTLLIDDEPRDWRLDRRTRETGLKGVAEARRLLHAVPRHIWDHDREHRDGGAVGFAA